MKSWYGNRLLSVCLQECKSEVMTALKFLFVLLWLVVAMGFEKGEQSEWLLSLLVCFRLREWPMFRNPHCYWLFNENATDSTRIFVFHNKTVTKYVL